MRGTGLVGEDRSLQWYASWDMPLLAAHGFPYAQGPALDLCADAMGFFCRRASSRRTAGPRSKTTTSASYSSRP
ncbi:hypothetical protein ACFYRL_34190 [Streptomyces goshikiensis]|uniref:hypothetical protein n=1 Tax=Streptomyces goshikiensis TaxID=1942 RepID=UPI003694D6FE